MDKAAYIIGSGLISPKVLSSLARQSGVLCADGGANYARSHNLLPSVVIGDLDSSHPETIAWLKENRVPIITHPVDKNATDLELAIDHAISLGARSIILTCILGDRMDHSVSNMMILCAEKYRGFNMTIHEDSVFACCLQEEPQTFHGSPGDTFSIIPISATVTGVTIKGAKWNLQNASLTIGQTQTISNTFQGSSVSVSASKGAALFLHLRDL